MLKDDVMDMYKQINLGSHRICQQCKRANKSTGLSKPLSLWNAGRDYRQDKYKLLLVGKNGRGQLSDWERSDKIIDGTKMVEELLETGRAFWKYSEEIARCINGRGGNTGIDNIAMTNLIKCNNLLNDHGRNDDGSANDRTTESMKDNCISNLQVIWKEIAILRPKNIVIFSHYYYDEYLDQIPNFELIRQKHDRKHTRINGNKQMFWWEREGRLNSMPVRILRTSHPERQNKEGFVKKITDWVKNSK